MNVPPVFNNLWRKIQQPPPHQLTESLFLRLLGLVYLAAFASLWPQIAGLLGSHGVAPAAESLAAIRTAFGLKAFYYVPSLFWFNASDLALSGACVVGCITSLLMVAGLFSRAAAAACYILYLSLVAAGQPFTGFQWDALLLECGFLALFAGLPWIIWAYRFLLFRLMFESGVVKLISHDPNWRNLHALRFHFMTQPLPTPLAYYFYRAPTWLLDSMTAATLVIELAVPFLLFCPRRFRYAAGILFILLQVLILLTGNYAFFNLLTLSLCIWIFDDSTYLPIEGMLMRRFPPVTRAAHPTAVRIGNASLAALMVLGAIQVVTMLWPSGLTPLRRITSWTEPFEAVNSYGLFAVMTTTRPEIVLEGSDDQTTWTEYSFRFKPGDLHRGLPLVAPYQPRLDWQMWFAALGNYRSNPWVAGLVYRLLLNDRTGLALLDRSPFTNAPHYIRAMLYDYTFSTPEERSRSGMVWNRKLLGVWLKPVALPSKALAPTTGN
jgi:hypothetical protein